MKAEDFLLLAGGGYLAYRAVQAANAAPPMDFHPDAGAEVPYEGIQSIVRQLKALAPSRSNMFIALDQAVLALRKAEDLYPGLPYWGNARDLAQTAIDKARGGIRYHESYLNDHPGEEPYSKSEDLKKRVVEAFEVENEIAAGVNWDIYNQQRFFVDVWQNIKDLPTDAITTLAKGVGSIVSGAFGGAARGILAGLFSDPIGIAAMGLVAYGVYRKVAA